mgnify:CR=1 FL=1
MLNLWLTPVQISCWRKKRFGFARGLRHVALEVLNAGYAHQCLTGSGADLVTDVSTDSAGHEQFFAADDPATGLQLGFISRTGHRVGVGTANVLALFDTLDAAP